MRSYRLIVYLILNLIDMSYDLVWAEVTSLVVPLTSKLRLLKRIPDWISSQDLFALSILVHIARSRWSYFRSNKVIAHVDQILNEIHDKTIRSQGTKDKSRAWAPCSCSKRHIIQMQVLFYTFFYFRNLVVGNKFNSFLGLCDQIRDHLIQNILFHGT